MKIRRALISVSDKTGLEELVRVLNKFGVEILSTGGTSKAIAALGIPVKDVSSYTGFPEMLDGRVKTLHPKIHGGILALRDDKEHMDTVRKYDIGLIDMVVVNLYPFEKIVSKPSVKLEEAIENIDIGGPSMLRSAAKNCRSVCVICDIGDYKRVIENMENTSGSVAEELLAELGAKVFARTSSYDAAIYDYLKPHTACARTLTDGFPLELKLDYKKLQDLRYGENPHQKAAFYKDVTSDEPGMASAVQLHGKELSFNNIIDLNAAMEVVKEFDRPAAVMGQSQKIKRLRFCPSFCCVLNGESSKLHHSGLRRFHLKSELAQPFTQSSAEFLRVHFVLKTDDKVVRITNQSGIPGAALADNLFKPQIKCVVKIYI